MSQKIAAFKLADREVWLGWWSLTSLEEDNFQLDLWNIEKPKVMGHNVQEMKNMELNSMLCLYF
jgi:hypothetical protein